MGAHHVSTSEMTELKVGDRIKDNEPRGPKDRVLTIVEILPHGVRAQDRTFRVFTILRRRIYTDGKPRRSGFDLVMGVPPTT